MAHSPCASQSVVLTAAFLLLSSVLVTSEPEGDNVPTWTSDCVQISGHIGIQRGEGTPENVPETAEYMAWCRGDEPIFELQWPDKRLNFFLSLKGDNTSVFQVHQISYTEGTETWFVNVKGFGSALGGEFTCIQSEPYLLEYEGGKTIAGTEVDHDQDGRRITLAQFLIKYAPSNVQDATGVVRVCRVDADLTVPLAVTGGVTGAILVSAALAARLVF